MCIYGSIGVESLLGVMQAGAVGGDVAKNAPDAGDLKNAGANVASKACTALTPCRRVMSWMRACPAF